MSLWGKADQSNNAPKFVVAANSGRTGVQEYGNTVFGYTAAEQTAEGGKAGNPGWVRIVKGQGAFVSFVVGAGGTLYANTNTVTVTAASGANATGTIVTNGSGVIQSVTVNNAGGLFTSDATITITTATGSGATITATYGGRAGRKTYETLVAMRTMS